MVGHVEPYDFGVTMQDIHALRAAHLDPRREPSDPPDARASMADLLVQRAEKVSKVGGALKVIVSGLVGAAIGVASAYGWAHSKADKSYVDAAEARLTKASKAVNDDLAAKVGTATERIAHLEGNVQVILDQNREILSMLRKLNELDERRGTPTRLPIREAR
jgi:hypothetical protein